MPSSAHNVSETNSHCPPIATKGDYLITTDRAKMDIPFIHHFLSTESYWCKNIPLTTVQRSIDHSLNFGVFHHDTQVGYARIISDFATVCYLGDVFIIPEHRGKGLSKWMMEQAMAHPDLKGLRRWILLTRDAHELYKQFGWRSIAHPDRWMEIHDPNVYQGLEADTGQSSDRKGAAGSPSVL